MSRRGAAPGRSRRYAITGIVVLGLLGAVALAAPLLAPYDPTARVGTPFAPPSGAHPLGVNDAGHDLLSELIYGARVSLLVGTVAAAAATAVGATVGVVAGYARGWVDSVLMRLVDVVLALPVVPLTLVLGVFLGPGLATQVLVIAAVIWAGIARELRAQVLSLRERAHIAAARAMGAPASYVLPRHVLPAVAPLVVPQFVLATKTAILLEASLAFLGLGDASAKSWGTMLYFAHVRSAFLTDAWRWWVLPPGLAIAATVLAFALLGFAFEERARPSLRHVPPPAGRRGSGGAGRVRGTGAPRRRRDTQGPRPPQPGTPPAGAPLVLDDLTVAYRHAGGESTAVNGVSLAVSAGEIVGLVGESGSGKSTLVAAATGLLPAAATVTRGTARVEGRDVGALGPDELRRLRGRRVALIPQEAMSALNPVMPIGAQVVEAVTAHQQSGRTAARRRAAALLEAVGLDPGRAGDHPHQLSGGMRQRVVIAIALANDPAVVIADEPTAGLDVVMQARLVDLLEGLCRRLGFALLIVSHDLPVLAGMADRLAVMHAGTLVEVGAAADVLAAPRDPATRRLVAAMPRFAVPAVGGDRR